MGALIGRAVLIVVAAAVAGAIAHGFNAWEAAFRAASAGLGGGA